ncbi:sulfotransferase domain-containing protein [Amphritea pacifica]|uniref:sulfotransferase domain-containing protein n=1 Tax=Amphritea pacifica TaxID=2811233 RepID=UPI00196555D6|nr:sulfotransferase domain-containing protein [Amphritea pacifica]
MNSSYLIIAGTEKSGTTSVYQYLNSHPGVSGSTRKETDYFRSQPPHTQAAYNAMFPSVTSGGLRMEASPGYLAESNIVASAIASVVSDAKILFILRDPIDRLLSSFEFHKSRFFIPPDMEFDEYVGICMRFERGEINLDEAGLGDWFLRVPDAGRYARHLQDYEEHFSSEQIKVLTLDRLQIDPSAFMREICEWAGLSAEFYDDFEFVRSNVTFSPRLVWLQRLGLRVNETMEPFFNRHPSVKRAMLLIYKRINGQRVEKSQMSAATAQLLLDYYEADVEALCLRFGSDVVEARNWLKKHRRVSDQSLGHVPGYIANKGNAP